jgi:hypothetical protein
LIEAVTCGGGNDDIFGSDRCKFIANTIARIACIPVLSIA